MIDDKTFLDIAKMIASKSHCRSHQVGAVAVIDGRIVATGINGTLAGTPNCDDIFPVNDGTPGWRSVHHDWSNIAEVHAEQNIIVLAAKYGIRLCDSVVYVTLEPCQNCLKLLAASGVRKVVYDKAYDFGADESIEYVTKYGMEVIQGETDEMPTN